MNSWCICCIDNQYLCVLYKLFINMFVVPGYLRKISNNRNHDFSDYWITLPFTNFTLERFHHDLVLVWCVKHICGEIKVDHAA